MSYKTIYSNTSSEVVEKKSKFIANLIYVESKEEAEGKIREYKKKYHDARHNCSAYRVLENGVIYEKSSDDGEPSGTAGAPMLNILQKNELCNVLIIVTRYFGGILLGTGGLVRCYSDSLIGVIDKSLFNEICEGIEYQLELEYNSFESFKYYCKNNEIKINNINYLEKIILDIDLDMEKNVKFLNDIEKNNINIIKLREIARKVLKKNVK